MFTASLSRNTALWWLAVFFIISIIVRIPTLNRPISKHHEFNTAVILIGIESWQQGGGASAFNFIPCLNYQQQGDYSLTKGAYTDDKGNYIYLSFGPGWYVIPYLFFEAFNMPVTPLSLQILNLVFNAIAVFLLFLLLERVWSAYPFPNRYAAVLTSCIVFIFAPGILWFLGNGYVCTGIMLPFMLAAIILFMSLLNRVRVLHLLLFVLNGAILIYIDWFGVFLYSSFGLASLFLIKKDRKIVWLTLASGAAILAGIGFIIWQFSSYVGSEQLALYWQSRFRGRSALNQQASLPGMALKIAGHFLSSYLPVLGLLLFLKASIKKVSLLANEKIFIAICLTALIPFNLVLLEWTYEHEFSIIPYSVLFCFLAGSLALRATVPFSSAVGVFLGISVIQYYYINRPGAISQNGSRYDFDMTLGRAIKKIAPPSLVIFSNAPLSPMMAYYAKRKVHYSKDKTTALTMAKEYDINRSIWISVNNGHITQATVLVIQKEARNVPSKASFRHSGIPFE